MADLLSGLLAALFLFAVFGCELWEDCRPAYDPVGEYTVDGSVTPDGAAHPELAFAPGELDGATVFIDGEQLVVVFENRSGHPIEVTYAVSREMLE